MADTLDDLLARGARTIDLGQAREASAALAREVVRTPVRSGRRIPRRVAIGVAALTLAVPATAAAAVVVGAHTGLFGDPTASSEDVDRSEWLNTCSADYPQVVRQLQPGADEPLPAGASWGMATTMLLHQNATACAAGTGGLMQETGLRRSYNYWAQCAWLRQAVDPATTAAQRPAVADALRRYGASKVNKATDGGGIVEHDLAVADQVETGNLTEAARQVRDNCGDFGVTQ